MNAGSSADRSVTVAIGRHIIAGGEERFTEVAELMTKAASHFSGHLGAGHIRPATPDGEHVIVFRFDEPAHFDAWRDSPERAALLEEVAPLMSGSEHVEIVTGLETWFHDSTDPTAAPPVRWKQTLAIWLAIFPTAYLLSITLGQLLEPVPPIVRVGLSTAMTVVLMTTLIMPAVTRRFGGWLRRR